MKETILIIIFISIILLFITINKNEIIFIESFIDSNPYLVRNLPDKKQAANTLALIKKKMKELIIFIKKEIETLKEKDINNFSNTKYSHMELYMNRILKQFNYIIIRESSANSKFTSYSVNKGEEMVFCLRSKKDNSIHDINELMYVAIHELAHVGCTEIGHTPLFLKINTFLLDKARDIGIYKYKNYSQFPEEYCGMTLTSNILN